MKVVILCGGLGTRLREETEFRPKPMVPIGGRPILWHIMKTYAHHGHKEFVLCLGYKGEAIKDFFRNYQWNTSDVTLRLGSSPKIQYHTKHSEDDWTVTLVDTGLETMTGGRLKQALPYIEENEFLMTYGDGLSNLSVNDSIAFHRKHGALATLTGVLPTGRFGEMGVDGDIVTSFSEKPEQQAAFINGGFFVLNKRIGDYIQDSSTVFESGVLPKLSSEGNLRIFKHAGFWQCMDTYREQVLLEQMWQLGKAPWKVW